MLLAGAAERIVGDRALAATRVPRSPRDLAPGWLTEVLCSDTPGACVTAVAGLDGSEGTTTRAALEVTYNAAGTSAGLPTKLFAKCTAGLAQRLMLGLGGLIEGEPGFYAHVRPSLAIEAPIGYFGAVDSASWRSIVLIEDVAQTQGATFWNPALKVTPERLRGLLATVAAWHGSLWDSPRLAEWRWLKTPAAQMRLIDALLGLADRTAVGVQRARAVIPSSLRARQRDLLPAMRRSLDVATRGPHTYLHGDLHIANTYLTRAGTVGVCDWQAGLRGSWAFDYAYLLATALEPAERRAWDHDLLDFYRERLHAAGGPLISHAEAWRAYRQSLFYPYFAWVYTIGRSRLQPAFQPVSVSLVMIERIATAIDDLDAFGAVGL